MRTRYISMFVVALAIAGIAVAINGYRQAFIYAQAWAIERAEPNIEPQLPTVGPIRNLRFTLFDAGIRPNEMRIKPGLVNIHIEDRTNISQGLTIRRILGSERALLTTVQKAPDQLRGRSFVRLMPGQYELFDASRPANKAVLLVEP